MVRGIHATDARADEPEEWAVIFGRVEQIREVECQQGEVISRIHAWIYLPQKPLVHVEDPLPERRTLR